MKPAAWRQREALCPPGGQDPRLGDDLSASSFAGPKVSIPSGVNRKACIFLLLLVAAVTASSLSHSFLFIDDMPLIVNNPKLDLTLGDLPTVFSKPLSDMGGPSLSADANFYRPALTLLYSLNYKIWGINPVGFHITNIFLHLLNAIALYHLGLLLFSGNAMAALLAASLFAVHPVHNELLGRVAMNENLLGFFAILCVYSHLRERRTLSLAFFIMALLTKESAFMVPFVLCSLSVARTGLKKSFSGFLPFALLMGLYSLWRIMVVGSFAGGSDPLPVHVKLYTLLVALTDYARLLLIPSPLHPFYPARFFTSLLDPRVLAAMGIFCCLAFIVWKIRKRAVPFALFLSIFLLLAPVIIKANSLCWGQDTAFIAERQLYVPSMFFALLIADLLVNYRNAPLARYAPWLACATILIFSLITVSHNRVWRDDDTLAATLMEDCPETGLAHSLKAEQMLAAGDLDGALQQYTAALYPNKATRDLLKQLDIKQNNFLYNNRPAGPHDLETFSAYHRRFASVHFNIGLTFFAKKDYANAAKKFQVASILRPQFEDAYFYLGKAHLQQGHIEAAREAFHTAERLKKDRTI